MAKNAGTVLGIIAILLGATGLGFGVISWLDVGQVSVRQSWYDTKDLHSVSISGATITDLSVTMTLNTGQSVYVSFTCIARCDGLWVDLYVYIDNSRTDGHTRVSREGVGGYLDFSAAIQHINNTLATGSHTITIWAQTDDSNTVVLDCVLLVQTLTI
jgi:hypothetical protein